MSIARDLFTRVSATKMSINERFTYLQKNTQPLETTVQRIRTTNAALQQASAKNRRLLMQMERRLTAEAALKIKKRSIRQRLGVPTAVGGPRLSVRDRLTLTPRGRGWARGRGRRGRGRGRGGSLSRSQSLQSLTGGLGGALSRSLSMQSLNQGVGPRGRSRSRSRNQGVGPRGRSRSRSRSRQTTNWGQQISPEFAVRGRQARWRQRSDSVGGQQQRAASVSRQRRYSVGEATGGRGVRGGRGARGTRRGGRQLRGRQGQPLNVRGRGGRGGTRGGRWTRGRPGRGQRGGRGRRNSQVKVPSKEELDSQLDQYMANSKSHLDKELDSYMTQSGVNELWGN